MKSIGLCSLALAGFLAFAGQSMAQNALMFEPVQPIVTTGMVGFTTNQTARLSVLNLNPASTSSPSSTTPITANNCTVELQFFDGQNNSLKQSIVTNFAPQTVATLDLTRGAIPTQAGSRAEIRGVVKVNPTATPVAGAAAPGYCTVFTTLQIFDDTTGSTVVLTSDTRVSAGGLIANPLTMVR